MAFRMGSRVVAWAATIMLTITAALTAFVLPAQAAGSHQLVSYAYEDQCLSANFNHDVYTTTCSGVIYHQWMDQHLELVNAGTGECVSSNPNTTIYTVAGSTCADSRTWHTWNFYNTVYHNGVLVRVMYQNIDSGLCLSTNNVDVFGTTCDPTHSQQWWYVS